MPKTMIIHLKENGYLYCIRLVKARATWFSTKMRCQTCRNSEGSHFFVYDPCNSMLAYWYVSEDRGLS